jgi:branched-chain amino acid transport system substrate-binding protein
MADVLLSLGHKTVAIMYPNNDYGKGLSAALAGRMNEKGGQVLESLTYQTDDQDFSAQLTTIKNLNPDAIALTGTQQDSGLIIKQIDQMGLGIPIIGGTGLYNVKTLEVSGFEAAEGVILIGVYVATNPDPKVRELVEKYKKKFDQTPDGFAALAYDQMYVIAQAATKAMSANKGDLTRDNLKDALKTTDYMGCTGHVKFNEVNDWVRPYLTLVVRDGEFVMFEP